MLKQSERIKERLKKVMMQDRYSGIETLLTILKSDIKMLLGSYMHLEGESSPEIYIEIQENGSYKLQIEAVTNKLIEPGKIVV